MRSRIHSAEPPDQLKAEALIRDALGDQDVDISDIKSDEIFAIHGAVLGAVVSKLRLNRDEIGQLILQGEQIAFDQGWKPPLAD